MPSGGHTVVILIRPGRPSLLKWDARKAIHPLWAAIISKRPTGSWLSDEWCAVPLACFGDFSREAWVENTIFELSNVCNAKGLRHLRNWNPNVQTDVTGPIFPDLYFSSHILVELPCMMSSKNNSLDFQKTMILYFFSCLFNLRNCKEIGTSKKKILFAFLGTSQTGWRQTWWKY